MTTEQIKAALREFILGRYPDLDLRDDEDIFRLGFVNSLFAMELVLFIESNFQLSIPNEELALDGFRTVDAMAALVERVSGRDVAAKG
ncbi:acyl carrier protein [Nocardiopsis gilva YIM 90087]|uniref:Acyl carrier protein n=1 Tax=Nocardiopsis gilva YIM 90087 TaxID=1235441 RepID=A0A223S7S9_9ACTN|nr:phosphopantetheine-binding protein [Nocardiopsis gilva]ASU84184.1 acyl carrier protein [Nocardiopsis gilva YIM 90087]